MLRTCNNPMREWVKVVLGVVALTVGASAPTLIVEAVRPGSIAPLYQRAPSSGNVTGRSVANDAIPNNGHGNVRAKPQDEERWYRQPEWWVALFTGLLFIATAGLWYFTYRLWRSTTQVVRDEQAALMIATESARAGRDSADALPTLETGYVFLIITQHEADFRAMLVDKNKIAIPPFHVAFNFVNHGKTPVILQEISVGVRRLAGDLPESAWADEPRWSIASRVMPSSAHLSSTPLTANDREPMTEAIADQINAGALFVYFFGCVCYEDIFGNDCETEFCWRYSRNDFEEWGGRKYNRRT